MGRYSHFISPKRRAVPTPDDIVNADGSCVFGTFESEFPNMDFVRLKHPTQAPQALNKRKLTLWEATEVHFDEGILLIAVSDMGFFGKVLHVFYNQRTKEVISWDATLPSGKVVMAPNLIDGSVTKAKTKDCSVIYVNNLGEGVCQVCGRHTANGRRLEYELNLTRISKPSVVSIPFGPNRPLYSQKDFFSAQGSITIDGETMRSDADSTAIVDDHRGFYPRHAHYDWVTTMGVNQTSGARKYLAFNLTRNQSIQQDEYNENLIWLERSTSLLPPVEFVRDRPSAEFSGSNVWSVRDEHGMVEVCFNVDAQYAMVVHTGLINIDYYISFGSLQGFVLDEDGTKYVLDGMIGMGEDKTLLF